MLDITSSIRDHPRQSTNNFDETDTDDQMIAQELQRLNVEFSESQKNSPTKQPAPSVPTFGSRVSSGQNLTLLSGSRPASSLTGVSSDDDYGP